MKRMKKNILSMVTTLLLVSGLGLNGLRAQNTFNVAAMNVDGLPQSIAGININPDSKGAAGALAISQKLATMGYNVIGVSEDFNYHTELMTYMTTDYNFGTYRGPISGLPVPKFNTDGLELFWKKNITVHNEQIYSWNQTYGWGGNGADEMIDKGFRFYQVTFNDSVTVDVYIVHMDAETDEQDLLARWSQLAQITAMILSSNNGNPVIVMGDTNCRYTRDKLLDYFINPINADPRFTIRDAWIEKEYDGVYPEFGAEAMMVHTLGYQKGEVVDKVFYINNTQSEYQLSANFYLQDTSFVNEAGEPLADHWPIVVEFTYEKKPVAKHVYQSNAAQIAWQGENPTAGGRYYIYHPASHTFLQNNDLSLQAVTEPTYAWTMTYQSVNQNVYTMNMFSGAYFFNLRKDGSSAKPSLSSQTQTIELSASTTTANAYKIRRTASPARVLNYGNDGYTGANSWTEWNDWLFVSEQQLRDSMRTYATYEAATCPGEPYEDALFSGLTEDGIYQTTVTNQMGYDSIVTLTLTVLPASECQGTALPEVCDERADAKIVLLNGQLYIRRDEALFDLTGRRCE